MATKTIPVVQERRRLVEVDVTSLTKTKEAVRRMWNLSGEFILQGKFRDMAYLVDIDDDDDLADLITDAEELVVHLVEEGLQRGRTSTSTGQWQESVKDETRNDRHFVAYINGQKVSSAECYQPDCVTEPPAPESRIVLEAKKVLEADFNFKALLRNSKDIPDLIRLARYAVAGYAKLEVHVDKIHAMVTSAIHKSNKALHDIGKGTVLDVVVDGINLLFRDDDGDFAFNPFENARTRTQLLAARAAELINLFQSMYQENSNTKSAIYSIEEEIFRQRNAQSENTLHYASMALKCLQGTGFAYADYWLSMRETLSGFAECHIINFLIERVKKGERELHIMHSGGLQIEVARYYAKWVALQTLCTTVHEGLECVLDDLVSSLADSPSVEEAREELPKMLQKQEERMRRDMKDLLD